MRDPDGSFPQNVEILTGKGNEVRIVGARLVSEQAGKPRAATARLVVVGRRITRSRAFVGGCTANASHAFPVVRARRELIVERVAVFTGKRRVCLVGIGSR